MTLLDHFRPPLSNRRHWHSFHNAWATYIAASLNETLPPGYFAEPNVQFGIEIDVATFEEANLRSPQPSRQVAETRSWQPAAPTQTIPFQLTTDIVEIAVFSTGEGPTLAGAIELISPANKDRPAHRQAFTAKCQTYLQQGIGLIVVDIVTTLNANLHTELLTRMNTEANSFTANLYAVAYQATQQAPNETSLNLWENGLSLNTDLPILPLWLRGGLCLPIDLKATYERTCHEQRIAREFN